VVEALIREARVFADAHLLTRGVAEESARIISDAIAARGRCTVCLSGGATPKSLNELWARDYAERIPWAKIDFFWGDERYVPHDDPRSNFRMTRETLLTHVAIPPENIHAVPTDAMRPADAAREYESEMKKVFAATGVPEFDLLFLGLGPEGHTASLFPESPALVEKQSWVVAVDVDAEPRERITITLPVINCARNVFFLVEGKKKREILRTIRDEPEGDASPYPAARVRSSGRVIWFLDQAAFD
jgi:6-phosphogluconolactonase